MDTIANLIWHAAFWIMMFLGVVLICLIVRWAYMEVRFYIEVWKSRKEARRSSQIDIGDLITNSPDFPNLKHYFSDGAKRVTKIETGAPGYAGGKFIYVDMYGKEKGFYLNAIRKVK